MLNRLNDRFKDRNGVSWDEMENWGDNQQHKRQKTNQD